MYRDILTNKWFLGGCGFLIILAISCYIWYQNYIEPYRIDAAASEEMLRQWEQYKTAKKNFREENGQTSKRDEPALSDETAKGNNSIVEIGDGPDAENNGEVRVSPNGFGHYPEFPEEWKKWEPYPWESLSPEIELMLRVRIKLLKQGIPAVGSMMDNGLIYPIISGVRYVEFGWSGLRRYITTSIGTPEDGDRLRAIKKAIGRPLTAADVPSDILLVPYEEAGIDPYTFLDLPK